MIRVRPAERRDLSRLTEIYNYYILNTPITFDIDPYTVEERVKWFQQFDRTGRHRLLVAEETEVSALAAQGSSPQGTIIGYAGTMRFRPKAAYDTTVETTVYCAPEAAGKGIGSQLYQALFDEVSSEDVHLIVAGYTMPNPASEVLHRKFGFRTVGVFQEVGRKFGKYWDVCWMERRM